MTVSSNSLLPSSRMVGAGAYASRARLREPPSRARPRLGFDYTCRHSASAAYSLRERCGLRGILRSEAETLFRAALAAANPTTLLREGFRQGTRGWRYGDVTFPLPEPPGRIRVLGAGKAACSLARALEEVLSREDWDYEGRVIVKHGHGEPLDRIVVEQGGHPLPDAAGLVATARLLEDLEGTTQADRVFFALTGGASALMVAPAEGLTLEDKIATTDLLLRSGATIQEMNAVRKHLSAVKGGRLLERVAPARLFGLVVSDVIGDDLSSIGSGPAVGDPTTFRDGLRILERYELLERVPPSVRSRLERGSRGELPETPKPGAPLLGLQQHVILASNRGAVGAAAREAETLGMAVEIFALDMVGDVHERATAFAERLLFLSRSASRPVALLAGGELTLKVTGSGRGGRNQELALVAARVLEGVEGVVLLSAGTDGTDGPTDAAGAFADGASWSRAKAAGLDPEAMLANNDAYSLFDRLGDLLRTGPTGTNVNDVVIGLVT